MMQLLAEEIELQIFGKLHDYFIFSGAKIKKTILLPSLFLLSSLSLSLQPLLWLSLLLLPYCDKL